MLLTLGLTGCQPGRDALGPARPAGSSRVTPAPDAPGPFGVGYRTVSVADDSRPGRVLTTAVWYPTEARLPSTGSTGPTGLTAATASATGPASPPAAAAPATQPASYELAPGVAYQSRVAVADAPPAPGQFPLVVFSHGSAGSRLQAVFLTEALASQGYVVAAPDHVGDTMLEVAAGRQASLIDLASDRSLDVTAVIDWMLCPSFPFAAHLRADQIAVVGFSFGGLTAVASSVGFLRAPADPRVKVSVGISPASGALPADLVARIRVPTLLIGGSLDGAAPVAAHADKTFDQLTGAPARLKVIVRGAEHNSFTDLCEQAYLASESGVPAGARIRLEVTAQSTCLPPVIEVARAQRVARWFTVAFLGRYLRGEPGYGRYLTAAATRDLPVSVDSAP